ncbi:MAG: hypothetical protein MUD01_22715, partial [Chloroflexaceae bacterium]|nr:hypothetical protein [Chloroflexaceae bacterium]
MRSLPQPSRYFIFGLWGTALLSSIVPLVQLQTLLSYSHLLAVLLFVGMVAFTDARADPADNGRLASVSTAFLIAALTSIHWSLVLVVIILSALCVQLFRPVPWWQLVTHISV